MFNNNSSPSTSRDISLSHLAEACWSLTVCLCSDKQKKTSKKITSLTTHTMSLKEQVAQLTLQIQVLQNQLSTQTMSPPVDPPPPPTMTKLLKIAAPTPFTGLQDELDVVHPVVHEGQSCQDVGNTQDPAGPQPL